MKVSANTVGVLTASATLGRLNELIEAGFQVTDISSTWDHVIVDLAKADHRVTLELGRDDARAVLGYTSEERARTVAAKPG